MANLPTGVRPEQKVNPESIFYQFTPEETKVMSECNRESFYQRCLPFSLISGAGVYMAVHAGYIKSSLKWGPWPKVIFGSMFGYLLGKYSYQNICAEKLMQLPNSEIGRVLRERRGKFNGDDFKGNVMTPVITPGTSDTDESSYLSDYKSNINIEMDKPINFIDTDYRPNYDGLSFNKTNDIPLSSSDRTISYEELRARNRLEHDKIQPNKPVYRPPPPSNSPIWDTQPYPPSEQTRNLQPRESRNQYGDVFNN